MSGSSSDSLARLSASIHAKPPDSNPDRVGAKPVVSTLPDLIGANITASDAKQTNNGQHVAAHKAGAQFASAPDYSNVNSNANSNSKRDDDDDQVWLTWMSTKLNKALETKLSQIGNDKLRQNGHQVKWERPKFCSSSSAGSLVSTDGLSIAGGGLTLASVAKNLAIVLGELGPNQTIIGQSQRAAMWQFLRQNKLVLYTCGASNTHGNHLVPAMDKEQLDKLAGIRPLFKSILVQANGKSSCYISASYNALAINFLHSNSELPLSLFVSYSIPFGSVRPLKLL